jgi:hypothetical protein
MAIGSNEECIVNQERRFPEEKSPGDSGWGSLSNGIR